MDRFLSPAFLAAATFATVALMLSACAPEPAHKQSSSAGQASEPSLGQKVEPIREVVRHSHSQEEAFLKIKEWLASEHDSSHFEVETVRDSSFRVERISSFTSATSGSLVQSVYLNYSLHIRPEARRVVLTCEFEADASESAKAAVERMKGYYREHKASIIDAVRK